MQCSARRSAGELIERTLAIVGGQVITLSDVRRRAGAWAGRPRRAARRTIAGATPRLVDRMLMLREVQRYAPPEPPEARHRRATGGWCARGLLTPIAHARALERGGFTEARVRAWMRDDVRIASYLAQRFAARVAAREEIPSPAIATEIRAVAESSSGPRRRIGCDASRRTDRRSSTVVEPTP